MKQVLLSSLVTFVAFLLLFGLPETARGDVYASAVRLTQDGTEAQFDGDFTDGTGATIRFILNDDADSVVVKILPAGGGAAVKTIVAKDLNEGDNKVAWDGSSDAGPAAATGDYKVEITAYSGGYGSWTEYFDSGDIDIFTRGVDVNKDPSHRLFGFNYAGNNGGPLTGTNVRGILQVAADGSPAGDTLGYAIKETIDFGFADHHVWSATLDKFGWVYVAGHGVSGSGNSIYQTKIEFDSGTRSFNFTTSSLDPTILNPIGLFWQGGDTLYFTSDGMIGRAYFDAAHTAISGWDTVIVVADTNFVRDCVIDDDGYLYATVQRTGAGSTFGGSDGWLEKYPVTGALPKTRADTMWRFQSDNKPLELEISHGSLPDASDDKIYMNFRRATTDAGIAEFSSIDAATSSGVTRMVIATKSANFSSASGIALDALGNVILFENSSEHIFMFSPPTGANSFTTTGVDTTTVSTSGVVIQLVDIAVASEDLDADFAPDRLGDTLRVIGVVNSVNLQTSNVSHGIQDETGAITLFHFGQNSPPLDFGDLVQVTGFIDQFNGLSEITPLVDSVDVLVLDSAQTVDEVNLTIGEFLADAEKYESMSVKLKIVAPLFDPTTDWPADGSSANLDVWDGVDTVTMRIDSDTEIDGSPVPTFPVELTGIGGQFTFSSPANDGYQILPSFNSDFVSINTAPLIPFTLLTPADNSSVTLDDSAQTVDFSWNAAVDFNATDSLTYNWFPIGFTSMLSNNNGADTVLTLTGEDLLSFLGMSDTVTFQWTVQVTDNVIPSAIANTDTSTVTIIRGTITGIAEDLSLPREFYLHQNYPNPFNPSTIISYGLPSAVHVRLDVYNILGQRVITLVNEEQQPGRYRVQFNNAGGYASGAYFYILHAGNRIFKKKMLLLK